MPVAPVPLSLADLARRRREPVRRTSSCSSSTACAATTCRLTTTAVTFTPAIDAFAAESTVFTHAFTRYGATGLSVPSIWVGGMVLHKQYVTPFAPMNTLHALLGRHGYRR